MIRQWGHRPGDRDLQLARAAARRCRRPQAVPLIASNTAGGSVGSLRVAGLISRMHLSRKTGKSDSVGTGEARCAEVSETLLCKRQRDKNLLGTSPVLQHLCWGRGYGAAKNSAAACARPASPTASGQMHRGFPAGHLTPGKGAWAGTCAFVETFGPKSKPRLSFWGEPVQGMEQPGAGVPDFPAGWSGAHSLSHHPSRSLEHLPWPIAAFFCLI